VRTNELQGRCVLARRLATREQVSQAFREATASGGDVCAALVARGILTPALAEHVRQTVVDAVSSGAWPALPSQASAAPPAPPDRTAAEATRVAAADSLGATRGGPRRRAGVAPGPGTVFGNYELRSELSRGGMGVIYRARHLRLEQEVAVKVLLQADPDPATLARFEREAPSRASSARPRPWPRSSTRTWCGSPTTATRRGCPSSSWS
jgi:hypothetical protein